MLEEKNRALAAFQASHESEVEQLGMELDRERSNSENMKVRLEGMPRFLANTNIVMVLYCQLE